MTTVTTTFETENHSFTLKNDVSEYRETEDACETAVRFLHTHEFVMGILQALDDAGEETVQQYRESGVLEALQSAYQTGERVRDHWTFEAFLRDHSDLDDELLAALQHDVAPIAEAFGAEIGIDATADSPTGVDCLISLLGRKS